MLTLAFCHQLRISTDSQDWEGGTNTSDSTYAFWCCARHRCAASTVSLWCPLTMSLEFSTLWDLSFGLSGQCHDSDCRLSKVGVVTLSLFSSIRICATGYWQAENNKSAECIQCRTVSQAKSDHWEWRNLVSVPLKCGRLLWNYDIWLQNKSRLRSWAGSDSVDKRGKHDMILHSQVAWLSRNKAVWVQSSKSDQTVITINIFLAGLPFMLMCPLDGHTDTDTAAYTDRLNHHFLNHHFCFDAIQRIGMFSVQYWSTEYCVFATIYTAGLEKALYWHMGWVSKGRSMGRLCFRGWIQVYECTRDVSYGITMPACVHDDADVWICVQVCRFVSFICTWRQCHVHICMYRRL